MTTSQVAGSVRSALLSSVARKAVSTLTGVLLVLFAISHLAANLLLLQPSGEGLNAYGESMRAFGPLFYVAEYSLFALFGVHAVQGILLKLENQKARGGVGYSSYRSKGGSTRWNLSSLTMAFSGIVLLAFVVIHLVQIRYGATLEAGYSAMAHGKEAIDLYRRCNEIFSDPVNVGIYVFAMGALGIHLRHGVWSALQGIGLMRGEKSNVFYRLSAILALLLAAGFAALPLFVYFTRSGGSL